MMGWTKTTTILKGQTLLYAESEACYTCFPHINVLGKPAFLGS